MQKYLAVRLAVATAGMMIGFTAVSTTAEAATPPLSDPHIVAHFDRPNGQVAESIIVEPDGSADVGLILSRQVAHVSLDGRVEVLATMPLPADGGVNTPSVGFAAVTGVERTEDGTVHFLYSAGDRHLTGLWKLPPGGKPTRIAALPATSFANGLARDNRTGNFYITDSTQGKVWQVRPHGGTATVWADGHDLSPTDFFGANGVKVHNGAVWVANIDRGTILRIPLTGKGTAGRPQIKASGLDSVDDFAFTGRGDQLLAALNIPSKVVLITPGRPDRTVLDQNDGLQNTTSVAVDKNTVYVSSGALTTGRDANLLTAHLDRR
ncbi:SMP-30/gluconolactonase/LRE family protein [Streptomyces sp. NPDC102274]|uniref:SMP-30/gluconolactonase/LRE family protein n=1 Tax=Streptomyces sp. NPDC102274 TaxID=3366151 RepID=UPI0038112F2A